MLVACSSLVRATAAGHFDEISTCVDPAGMKKCHEKAERGFANCITSNCSGDGKSCYDACRGDAMCMDKECPSLGVECINSCGCVKAIDRIDCVASSCWNQVSAVPKQQQQQQQKKSKRSDWKICPLPVLTISPLRYIRANIKSRLKMS